MLFRSEKAIADKEAEYAPRIEAAVESGNSAEEKALRDELESVVSGYRDSVKAYDDQIKAGDQNIADLENKKTAAQTRLEAKVRKDKEDITNSLRRQQSEVEDEKREAEKALADKKDAVTDRTKDLEDRQDELKDLNDQIDRIFGQSGLQTLQEAIDKAQEEVDKLKEKTTGATITAPISGTVTKLNVTAGNSTSADTPVAVMQPEGKGYTLSFSVTNEQARRLSVGDKADLVNAWRYDDIDVTLSSIKPDNTDPGQKKLLTFDVTGSTVRSEERRVGKECM